MSGLARRLYHQRPPRAGSLAARAEGLYLRWWRYGHLTERLAEKAREREQWSAERCAAANSLPHP